MWFVSAKKRADKIEEFLRRHKVLTASGDIKDIPYPATFWTKKGRQKMLKKVRRKLRRMLSNKGYNLSYQITLTYRSFSDYQKGDLRKFLNSFFRPFRYRQVDYKYFWVAEFQKRGMLHYHLLVFVKKSQRSIFFSFFEKSRIDKLWNKGYVFITCSYKLLKKAYNYALKYLVKTVKSSDDSYLDLVAFFRDSFGSFRLYGMSRFRRWGKIFRRKDFLKIQHQALNMIYNQSSVLRSICWEYYFNLRVPLSQLLERFAPWLFGVACLRTGKIVPSFSDLPLPLNLDKIQKIVDKMDFSSYIKEDEIFQILIDGGF